MPSPKIPDEIQISSKEQKPYYDLESPIEISRRKKYGSIKYKPIFPKLVYDLLSRSQTAKNKSHCCALLQCKKATLLKWMRKYPEFNEAIVAGLEIGKSKWYSKLATHAFKPSGLVNNGLIKLLSANVYGIKDDSESTNVVVNTTTITADPEKIMEQRGIPIPKIDIEDVEEDEE